MRSVSAVALRFGVFVVAMVLLLVVVLQVITRPVAGDTVMYRAVFTDADGLAAQDDVRMFGVQVGKVVSISLDGTDALVRFTVQRGHPLYGSSVLAIRFQALTGQRYIDVQQQAPPGAELRPSATIGTDHTVASFDITALFNGLEPVLAEFSPGALNHFAQTILAALQGNGSGLGPALDAIEKLSEYLMQRQALLSGVVGNLSDIFGRVSGRAPNLVVLLNGLQDVSTALQQKVDGLIDFAEIAPPVLGPINSIAATLGLTYPMNPILEQDLRQVFPDPAAAMDLLGKLPGLLQALDALIPNPGAGVELRCSKGTASAPGILRVLIGGRSVTLCNG
ncbi:MULTISPECIES: MlaD family protein [unclassified Nocardia]|uniref:MlaD family protein n=1 Tax=unclassified Nocardia TaxID=2637762 RepID=UPI001CE3D75F|nr:MULTISPECIES: MlaD family protein [unclassified Nocardia]